MGVGFPSVLSSMGQLLSYTSSIRLPCRKLVFIFFPATGIFFVNSYTYCKRESSLFFLVGFIVVFKKLYAFVIRDFDDM